MDGRREDTFMYRYFLFVFLLICPIVMAGDEVYQSPKSFLIEAFSGDPPAPSMLWLTPKLKEDARTILAHAYIGLRVRYWLRGVAVPGSWRKSARKNRSRLV